MQRRTLLKTALLAGPGLLFYSPARPHSAIPKELAFGLFFNDEDIPAIRERFAKNPIFAGLKEEIESFDRAAERKFIGDEVKYNDHLFHIPRLCKTIEHMAFHYLMTEDRDAAGLAMESIRAIMKFPRWDYFLDGSKPMGLQRASKSATAICLGIDWLGDLVESEEREVWLREVGKRGCEPCFQSTYGMRYPDRVDGWRIDPESTYFEHRPGDRTWDLSNWPIILNKNNLKAEPAAALVIGALALERQFGPNEDTDRWVEQAIYSISGYQEIYERDGSYNEGISYAGATSTHLFQAYSILSRFRETDFFDQLNWQGFMDFAFGMSLPTEADPSIVINFGDVGRGLPSAVPFWIASRTKDPMAQWFGAHRSPTHNIWSVLWHPENMPEEAPANTPTLWLSDLEWIVSRTGYRPSDLTVAMRSGPPYNHEHADRNSVIVKCFGEQLVVDPNRPSYTRIHPTWMMRGTVGHSAVLIDGEGHQYVDGSEGTNASDAIARLVRYGERKGYHFWASDATHAYQLVMPDVESITRTVVVFYETPAVLLIDKVIKQNEASNIQARFFADNLDGQGVVEATTNGMLISRPLANLRAFAYSPSGLTTHAGTLSMPDEIASKYPFADIGTQEASTETLLITVLMPERTPGNVASAQITPHSDGLFTVEIQNGNQHLHCAVNDSGALPEVFLE